MADRKNVIANLTRCQDGLCDECELEHASHYILDCEVKDQLINDALELLKEQEPRVLSAAEVIKVDYDDVACYVEVAGDPVIHGAYRRKYDDNHTLLCCDIADVTVLLIQKKARLWNHRPTDEQRKAVKWGE